MTRRYCAIMLALLLCLTISHPAMVAMAGESKQPAKEVTKKKKKSPALKEPKGGWANMGPTGILAVKEPGGFVVRATMPDSPAAGVLNAGDVIVKIAGQEIAKAKQFGAQLTKAINEAEVNGALALTLKDGRNVTLKIPVLGDYAPSAPYDCPKTEKIIAAAAKAMAEQLSDKRYSNKLGSGPTNVEILGLMATGEQQYIDVVAKFMRDGYAAQVPYTGKSLQAQALEAFNKTRKGSPTVGTWQTAYAAIAMGEYYLLTKDETILPALKTYAMSLVEGQDAAGMYGHKMVNPVTRRAPGYGQMNSVTIPCLIGMQLARKSNAIVPGLDEAIARTEAYVEYYVGRGGFPYGFHAPNPAKFNNNGTSAMAAISMALAGKKEAAQFFSQMTAAEPDLGVGHASSLFSTYWSPAGANLAGPEVTRRIFPQVTEYLTPRRLPDGSFAKCYSEGHMGGVALLAYCLPRKALIITGREADPSLWLDAKQAEAVTSMKTLGEGKTPEELLSLFNHNNPVVRHDAVSRIKEMVGADAKSRRKLEKMEQSEKRNAKDAKWAAQVAANKKQVAALFPRLREMITSGKNLEKATALQCYLLACPDGEMKSRVEKIVSILRNSTEADQVRVEAVLALASTAAEWKPYLGDVLKFLMEERPADRFGAVDYELGLALDQMNSSVEWKFHEAGLVTNKDLFYRASSKLMEHKRQKTRGAGVRMVNDIPGQQLHRVILDLEYILKDEDTTYHSYHSMTHAIQPASNIFSRLNILEGVGYLVDIITESKAKQSFILRAMFNSLPKYGIHAQPHLDKIKNSRPIKVLHGSHANYLKQGKTHPQMELYLKMVADIENAKDGPEMISIQEVLDEAKKRKER